MPTGEKQAGDPMQAESSQKTVNLLEQIHRKYNKKELLEHLQQPFLKIAK